MPVGHGCGGRYPRPGPSSARWGRLASDRGRSRHRRLGDLLPIPDLDQLKRDVVVAAALFDQRDELAAGIVGMMAADDGAHLVIQDVGVQAVGAMEDEVAVVEKLGGEFRLAGRLHPHAARQLAALGARHRLALEHEPELHRQGRGHVVLGQAADGLLADEVGARVADVGDADRAVAEDRGHQGGRHGLPAEFRLRLVVHVLAGGREHPPQDVVGLRLGRRLLEDPQALLDR